jgi:hypothetical protein
MSNLGPRLFCFDLDSTLMDTPDFIRILPLAANTAFGINSSTFAPEIPSFYDGKAGYVIEKHFAKYGRDLLNDKVLNDLAADMLEIRRTQSGQPDFLYPDARKLIRQIKKLPPAQAGIDLLSVNPPRLFALKLLLCPALKGIPARSTLVNKGQQRIQEWRNGIVGPDRRRYASAIVVDDGADQLEQLVGIPNVTPIQIYRKGQRYPRTHNHEIGVIGDLTETPEIRAA